MTFLRRLRTIIARRRLQRIVDEARNSFETRDYRKRRAAMLKHTRPDPRLG